MSQGLRPLLGDFPEDVKVLIRKCWDGDASKRPSELNFSQVFFLCFYASVIVSCVARFFFVLVVTAFAQIVKEIDGLRKAHYA